MPALSFPQPAPLPWSRPWLLAEARRSRAEWLDAARMLRATGRCADSAIASARASHKIARKLAQEG